MRIAIVNDLLMAVEALRRVVVSAPGHEIAWIARDGAEAVKKCAEDTPDLILMDLIMPVMGGAEATRRIMAETPCAILVVTATVQGNASKVFEAMGYGALDAVNTPVLGADGTAGGGEKLLEKIRLIERLVGDPGNGERATPIRTDAPQAAGEHPPLIAIGSSTGGPKALSVVLGALPPDFPAAIVVVQHVNTQFAEELAAWLDRQSPLAVRLAPDGGRPEAGTVLIPATDDHLVMTAGGTLAFTQDPRDYPYRPSVNVFFKSVADHWPTPCVAALLTGMGSDGAEGLLALRRARWLTIAQDEATSVVYGMPKAAARIGAADEILPLDAIAPALVRAVWQLTPKP